MAGKKGEEIVRCSFCGKTQAQVRKLIAGPNGAYICDECIELCNEILDEEREVVTETNDLKIIEISIPLTMRSKVSFGQVSC